MWHLWGFVLYNVLVLARFRIFRDLPHPEQVPLSRFGYRLSDFPKSKPWGLFSYPNVHEITLLEVFPSGKGYEPYGTYHPLVALADRQGTNRLRTDLPKSIAFRVLALGRSPCSSSKILLPPDSRSSFGVCPFRVWPPIGWNDFHRFLPSHV
jgi:hypothetical protein